MTLLLVADPTPGIAFAHVAPPDGSRCEVTAAGGGFNGQSGILINGECVSVSDVNQRQAEAAAVPTRTVVCLPGGTVQQNGAVVAGTCGANVPACKRVSGGGDDDPVLLRPIANQTRVPGTDTWISTQFSCPTHVDPVTAPTGSDVRDQAVRFLPRVPVETTGPNTLVNIQTLFWADTPTRRDLGTVTVLGQPVRLKLVLDHVDWGFGDDTTDRADDPGTPYDAERDRCDTKLCPDYYGHIYRVTGPMTITATVAWNASYSLDGTHWAPVGATPISGPTGTVHVLARQARVQLLAD